MAFDWSDFLTVAVELAEEKSASATSEARKRTAISRAYYAALQIAKKHLRDKDLDPNIPHDRSLHTYVIETFQDHPDPIRRKVGFLLRRLYTQRGRADYKDTYPDLDQQVATCLDLAKEAILLLTKL
jgi:uncharacterized protein (UPF0332 family)